MHPYLTQDAILDLAKRHGIAVTAYSSFGPQSYIELGMDKSIQTLLEHDVVAEVAKVHQKSA
jgi:D-xylose reductase